VRASNLVGISFATLSGNGSVNLFLAGSKAYWPTLDKI
jgi:hypothetical protein